MKTVKNVLGPMKIIVFLVLIKQMLLLKDFVKVFLNINLIFFCKFINKNLIIYFNKKIILKINKLFL